MNETQFKGQIMPLHNTLFAYALAILQNESDAEDCMQEALTRLWEHRKQLKKVNNVSAYATATVRNIAFSMATRAGKKLTTSNHDLLEIFDSSPPPDISIEGKDDVRIMAALLDTLPDNQKKVVVMSAVSGLSTQEISTATGLSDTNVRVLLSRGRNRLRQLFSNLTK